MNELVAKLDAQNTYSRIPANLSVDGFALYNIIKPALEEFLNSSNSLVVDAPTNSMIAETWTPTSDDSWVWTCASAKNLLDQINGR